MQQRRAMQQQQREEYRLPGESAGGGMADSARLRNGDGLPMRNFTQTYQPGQAPQQTPAAPMPVRRNTQNAWESMQPQGAPVQVGGRSNTQNAWEYQQQTGGKAPAPAKEPVLPSRTPLSKEVVSTLEQIPGGKDLYKLREKHSSNAHLDKTVRLAADIVINAMITNDTSDPDFDEALGVLSNAGYKVQ